LKKFSFNFNWLAWHLHFSPFPAARRNPRPAGQEKALHPDVRSVSGGFPFLFDPGY
jgi:hypothetical protein